MVDYYTQNNEKEKLNLVLLKHKSEQYKQTI